MLRKQPPFEALESRLLLSSVAITNASFEAVTLANGQYTITAPAGWTGGIGNTVGTMNISNLMTVADGKNNGYINSLTSSDNVLSQQLSEVLTANTTYTLKADLSSEFATLPGYRMQLWAGSTLLAEDNSSLTLAQYQNVTSTVTYTAAAGSPLLGQNLTIRFVAKASSQFTQLLFDNVRLDAITTPAAPTGLTATPESSSKVNVSWNDQSTESGYVLEISTDASTWSTAATTLQNQTSFTVTGLSSDTTYYFRVKALNGAVSSNYSSVISTRTMRAIAITNASFEAVTLPDGQYVTTVPQGWTGSAGCDVGTQNMSNMPVPDGNNVAYVQRLTSAEDAISQQLNEVLTANTTYTLKVDVGNQIALSPGYRVQLWAGSTLLAEDNSSLSIPQYQNLTSTVTYTASADSSLLGQKLTIRLVTKPSSQYCQTLFDNVRLDAIVI